MKIQLLRHATTIIEYGGKKFLVDPVLCPAGVRNPFPTKEIRNWLKNPLINIPIEKIELDQLINSIDAILITHTHSDHFDDFKGEFFPRDIKIFCQPEDVNMLTNIGFNQIEPIEVKLEWNGINIIRTECNHGGIYLRRLMGKGSGYVLKGNREKALYITGDTIWCDFVQDTIKQYNPEVIIIYGGAAQLPFGRSITMNEKDIEKVCQTSKKSQKIIVHMEAINHCLLKRNILNNYLNRENIANTNNVHIPKDGQIIVLDI